LVETYLPAWKSCVQDGGARSVMCSYNSVNGVPSCASDFLLKEILRGEFGFDGYVVSDCDAIDCIQNDHHYTDNPGDTCRVAVRAGTDLDCGSFYSNLPIAIKEGKLHLTLIKLFEDFSNNVWSLECLIPQNFNLTPD